MELAVKASDKTAYEMEREANIQQNFEMFKRTVGPHAPAPGLLKGASAPAAGAINGSAAANSLPEDPPVLSQAAARERTPGSSPLISGNALGPLVCAVCQGNLDDEQGAGLVHCTACQRAAVHILCIPERVLQKGWKCCECSSMKFATGPLHGAGKGAGVARAKRAGEPPKRRGRPPKKAAMYI